MRFKDKHVIVTGGGTGIGRGIVHRFAREGARVVIADRNVDNGNRVVEEVRAQGGEALFVRTDVADPAAIENLLSEATKCFGPVDVAVSNAAVTDQVSSALKSASRNGTRCTRSMCAVISLLPVLVLRT